MVLVKMEDHVIGIYQDILFEDFQEIHLDL